MAPMCNAALTVSLVAWDHERKLLENQSSRLESKKHQDLHQRKRGHAHLFDETIEEAFRERRRRKRQMSLVTLEDVSREKRDEEIQEEIRSIVRIVEDRRGRKNVEEKRKKKKKKRRKTLRNRSGREFLFFVVVLVRTLLLLIEMLRRHSLRLRECWRWKRNNAIAARRVVRYNNFVLLLYIFTIVILKICYVHGTVRMRILMKRYVAALFHASQ